MSVLGQSWLVHVDKVFVLCLVFGGNCRHGAECVHGLIECGRIGHVTGGL